jgi:hypothetical protein
MRRHFPRRSHVVVVVAQQVCVCVPLGTIFIDIVVDREESSRSYFWTVSRVRCPCVARRVLCGKAKNKVTNNRQHKRKDKKK